MPADLARVPSSRVEGSEREARMQDGMRADVVARKGVVSELMQRGRASQISRDPVHGVTG